MKCPRILVIRSDDPFSKLLRDTGFEVINLELIRTAVKEDLSQLENAISELDRYDGLFFTSPVAAGVFLKEIKKSEGSMRSKIYALGRRTRRLFEDAGHELPGDATANTAEELIASFDEREFADKRLLFVRGDKSLRIIPELLGDKAIVDEVIVYETKAVVPDRNVVAAITDQLDKGAIDWTCFFSPSAVAAFAGVFGTRAAEKTKVAVIGKTTAGQAAELGLRIGFISERSTSEEFAQGLITRAKIT